LKPVVSGLLDREGAPPAGFLGVAVRGFVVKAGWADLQPSPGGGIAADNAIDKAIAQVRQLNAAHSGLELGLRLRIYAGVDAPGWAKSGGGGPVQVTNPQSGETATIGKFWAEPFGGDYAAFEKLLAARYDGVPEIREVVISRCTTFFAEPFLRDKGDAGTVANLISAGFTTSADHACHREEIDAHKVWQHTRSDLELNPYQDIERKGKASVDEAFTEEMMRYCRATLGARCVLENNSLADPPKYVRMYSVMKALGGPISFQTATAAKIGDLQQALALGAEYGATSVELPSSYTKDSSPQALAAPNARLEANAR